MSRLRGVLPLSVATGVGIISGLWIFEPAFKEQHDSKENSSNTQTESASKPEPAPALTKSKLPEDTQQKSVTGSNQQQKESRTSPWLSFSFWSAKPETGSAEVKEVKEVKSAQTNGKPQEELDKKTGPSAVKSS